MSLAKRLLALEEIKIIEQVDNTPWVIEVVAMDEDTREIVTIGRHWHFKDEV